MTTKQGTLFLIAGAGALLLMSGKKKKKKRSASSEPEKANGPTVVDQDDLDQEDGIFETDEAPEPELDDEPEDDDASAAATLARHMDPSGRAQLGMLYQIKSGDTPLEVCREALFGSREPVMDGAMIQAATDLLVRIDCGPWNQALYGVPLADLKEGHANIDSYFTQRGVSFYPIYQDNGQRILNGLSPTADSGTSLALIWIPMINLERLDIDGTVTTEGMSWPDTENGMGSSMIDPPEEILDLEFEEVSSNEVGCDLPEGDFRRAVVAN